MLTAMGFTVFSLVRYILFDQRISSNLLLMYYIMQFVLLLLRLVVLLLLLYTVYKSYFKHWYSKYLTDWSTVTFKIKRLSFLFEKRASSSHLGSKGLLRLSSMAVYFWIFCNMIKKAKNVRLRVIYHKL